MAVMQEQEWRTCNDPTKMLAHLGVDHYWGYVEIGPAMWAPSRKKNKLDRKLRLFACACARRVWHLIPDEAGRQAVEIAEQFADRQTTGKILDAACVAALRCTLENEEIESLEDYLANLALLACLSAASFLCSPLHTANRATEATGNTAAEQEVQANLLRDVIGNPFQPLTLEKTTRTSIVEKIALSIYEERSFGDLPILADALEEAGCATDEIVTHCRSPIEHVRGCWVVDLILGKK